ncbi:hypothetical protein Sango_0133600 [Sesamum angolense]|uniref:Coatomer subunit zeta n=1 Tax=Sesamum angolense TaxID=2727404 RepID=A0AAE1XET1_9LAMI|nr:hypothetical protein Sango_0133600 [Sesamum angolense]
MLLAVLIANSEGNILVERFNGVPAEERLHWRSFLVKLGADNLRGVKNEELLVANHKSVYIVYTVLGDVSIFVVGKDEYDELALAETIFVITSALKDVCGKPPTERLFLDKYGKICLCLDEIVWKTHLAVKLITWSPFPCIEVRVEVHPFVYHKDCYMFAMATCEPISAVAESAQCALFSVTLHFGH